MEDFRLAGANYELEKLNQPPIIFSKVLWHFNWEFVIYFNLRVNRVIKPTKVSYIMIFTILHQPDTVK